MIQKIIHQIWIGPLPRPEKWMESWPNKNPEYKYMVWGNRELFGKKWVCQKMIGEYVARYIERIKKDEDVFVSGIGRIYKGEKATAFAWHVIADIMRYEILYKYGGIMPGSDTECLIPIKERKEKYLRYEKGDIVLYNTGHMYKEKWIERMRKENKTSRDKTMIERYDSENAAPVHAAKRKHPFVGEVINKLKRKKTIGEAVDTTGNVLMGKMIKEYPRMLKNAIIVPYKPDNPEWGTKHYAGTTKGIYSQGIKKKNLDIVYITDGNNKNIKYAIRSAVENLKIGKVVIVGPEIKGIRPDIHIDIKDKYGYSIKNVARKIMGACNDPRISEEFIITDDDVFILKPYEVKYKHKGRWDKKARIKLIKGTGPDGYHQEAKRNTYFLLGRKTINYSTHCPFIINKKKYIKAEEKYKLSSGKYLIRTVYGNEYNVGGELLEIDYKKYIFSKRKGIDAIKEYDREIISTPEKMEKSKEFKKYIKEKFPNKSKYEK
jgi:hypothetical protein